MSEKDTAFKGIKDDAIKQLEGAIDTLEEVVVEASGIVQDDENLQKDDFNSNNDDKVDIVQNEHKENDKNESENKKQSFGKFKNPEQLLKAYEELEKEFTRRSQKLAQYESGSVQVSEEEWKNQVDKFFDTTPSARPFARDIALEIMSHPELKQDKNCLSVALTRVLIDKFRTPSQLMQDGQFLKEYVLSSSKVKDMVIADYLDSLQKGKPPVSLGVGGLQCVAPSLKPKSIQEAGAMFLKNNE